MRLPRITRITLAALAVGASIGLTSGCGDATESNAQRDSIRALEAATAVVDGTVCELIIARRGRGEAPSDAELARLDPEGRCS